MGSVVIEAYRHQVRTIDKYSQCYETSERENAARSSTARRRSRGHAVNKVETWDWFLRTGVVEMNSRPVSVISRHNRNREQRGALFLKSSYRKPAMYIGIVQAETRPTVVLDSAASRLNVNDVYESRLSDPTWKIVPQKVQYARPVKRGDKFALSDPDPGP